MPHQKSSTHTRHDQFHIKENLQLLDQTKSFKRKPLKPVKIPFTFNRKAIFHINQKLIINQTKSACIIKYIQFSHLNSFITQKLKINKLEN